MHLRLHSALDAVITTLLSAVSAAGSSGERWPNYIDYGCGRATYVPLRWRTPPLLESTLVEPVESRALPTTSMVTPYAVHEAVHHSERPWVVRNPDVPRTSNCPHCGPGVAHTITSCESYSAYKRSGGQPTLPSGKYFTIGVSYNQAVAAKAAAAHMTQ